MDRHDRAEIVRNWLDGIPARMTADLREDLHDFEFDDSDIVEGLMEELIQEAGSNQEVVCFLRAMEERIQERMAEKAREVMQEFADWEHEYDKDGENAEIETDRWDALDLVDLLFPDEVPGK